MKIENAKCGEIFRCGPGKFIFSCTHCGKEFNSKTVALNHIEHHFIVDLPSTESKSNNYVMQESLTQEIFIDILEEVENATNTSVKVKEESPLNVDSEDNRTSESYFPVDLLADCSAVRIDNNIRSVPDTKYRSRQTAWGPQDAKSIVECDICGNHMKKRSIIPHLQSHANLKQHICSVCNRGYNTAPQLKKHTRIHSEFKKFSCDYCGWQFHDRTNLVRHIRKHTGEKPYKCKICEKTFAQSNSVIVHMRSHTGEKPFKCSLCGRPFNAQNMLQRHMRRHANEKKFKCNCCDRTFYSGTALRDHRRSQHTGERPYVCAVCKNTFSRRSAYRQHLILHTGQKPYKCRFCEIMFAQGAGRRSHERSMHKEVAHLIGIASGMVNLISGMDDVATSVPTAVGNQSAEVV